MEKHFEAFEPTAANNVVLSPISFLNRAEAVHGDRTAIIYGDLRRNWSEVAQRTRKISAGLRALGIGKGHQNDIHENDAACSEDPFIEKKEE